MTWLMLKIAAVACFVSIAQAAPITYTLTSTGSGTLGASTFTNATVTVTVSGDTSGITPGTGSLAGTLMNTGTATVTIGGLGTATFTDPIAIVSTDTILFQGTNAVIILDNPSGTGILLQEGTAFSGYGLGAMAPVTGTGGVGSGSHMVPAFPTTKGNLTWAVGQALGTSTFTASTTTTTPAGTTTNVTLNLTESNQIHTVPNQFSVVETGTAGPLGAATLSMSSTPTIVPSSGQFVAPILFTATLSLNQADSIVAVFMDNDVNFLNESPLSLSGGTITDGTGVYAGASGSLNLNFTLTNGVYLTTGSGSVTVGSKTTPLNLTNFRGGEFCSPCTEEYNNVSYEGTASPLGNVILNSTTDVTGSTKSWFATVTLNATDSFNLFSTNPSNNFGVNFTATVSGGTGAYAGATGSFAVAFVGTSNSVTGLTGSGTLTTSGAGVPVITSVKTAFGLPAVAYNTWLQINGTNLAPANTPSGGVIWSTAPSFAQGLMPTQIGTVSVTINGLPGYLYFYCSAATDTSCASDQINVLSPLDTSSAMYPVQVVVTNNGVASAPFTVLNTGLSPTFPLFDVAGHVVARHLDFSLLGPSSLFPGASTPAKAGETIILVLYGLGPPTGTPPAAGSATQSGAMLGAPECWVAGIPVPASSEALALISPGLYQLNLAVPAQTPSGDNPIVCNYMGYPTAPGTIIAVQ